MGKFLLGFVFQIGWIEIVARPVGDPLGNLFRNIGKNPTAISFINQPAIGQELMAE